MELNHKQLEMIRAAVKPGDGWDGDAWELRLCEEAIEFARRAERAASNPASRAKDCGACGDGCTGRACRVEAESPPASPTRSEILELAKARFGWAYGLGGFEDAILDFVAALAAPSAPAASPAPAITDERAAFEASVGTTYGPLTLDEKGFYSERFVWTAWCAWQARAALSSAPMAQAEPTLQTVDVEFKRLADTILQATTNGTRNEALRSMAALFDSALAATPAVPAAPSERDAKDAARYRWLRDSPDLDLLDTLRPQDAELPTGDEFDKLVEAAMSAAPAAPIERENG